ncbi:limit dextrinase [Artemisia annua]|uniref:Limit dextrinase n=1 Tax=Artemisia annua TaxID=35608 RepID=A0A2U1MQJ2_ARTAN|nr:limit dextrinase [Artemisia annua]
MSDPSHNATKSGTSSHVVESLLDTFGIDKQNIFYQSIEEREYLQHLMNALVLLAYSCPVLLTTLSIYHPSTLRIEKCIANDPYARGLSVDGKWTFLVNLDSDNVKPHKWDNFAIFLKEPAGVLHLKILSENRVTHIHLLPTFQFRDIDVEKEKWKFVERSDMEMLKSLPPDSADSKATIHCLIPEYIFRSCRFAGKKYSYFIQIGVLQVLLDGNTYKDVLGHAMPKASPVIQRFSYTPLWLKYMSMETMDQVDINMIEKERTRLKTCYYSYNYESRRMLRALAEKGWRLEAESLRCLTAQLILQWLPSVMCDFHIVAAFGISRIFQVKTCMILLFQDVPSVVIPNHLQVQSVECSCLSFGSFGATTMNPGISGSFGSSQLSKVEDEPAEADILTLISDNKC